MYVRDFLFYFSLNINKAKKMHRTTAFLPSGKKIPKVTLLFWYGHGFATRSLVPNIAVVG
jgi:hypothetical protein